MCRRQRTRSDCSWDVDERLESVNRGPHSGLYHCPIRGTLTRGVSRYTRYNTKAEIFRVCFLLAMVFCDNFPDRYRQDCFH